jgi:hypothetical protein
LRTRISETTLFPEPHIPTTATMTDINRPPQLRSVPV